MLQHFNSNSLGICLCLLLVGVTGCTSDAPPAASTAMEQPTGAPGPEETPPAVTPDTSPASVAPTWRPINDVVAGSPSSNCHIDSLAGVENVTTARVKRGAALGVSGWIATQDGARVPSDAWVRVEDGTNGRVWEVPVTVFTQRQDVAEAAAQPALTNSGFSVSISTAELPLAAKHVYLAFRHEGRDYICDGGHQVIIE